MLVEGKTNLYNYKNKNLKRFFFNKENSKIELLVHKRYVTGENKVKENNRFKQQLASGLNCSTMKNRDFSNLKYQQNSLVNFFVKSNQCIGSDYRNYLSNHKRDYFNLTLRPRVNSSTLNITEYNFFGSKIRDFTFENSLNFGLGIETEFILPFNKNKWALLFEPAYQYYRSTTADDISNGNITAEVKYNSVELSIGARHYLFLDDRSKLFMNISYIIDISLNSFFQEYGSADSNRYDLETWNNLAFGIGYKLKDKYSVEARYQTNRKILYYYSGFDSAYTTISIVFGYSFF